MKSKIDRIVNYWVRMGMVDEVDISEFADSIKEFYSELIIYAEYNTESYPLIYRALHDTLRLYVETIIDIRNGGSKCYKE